MNFSVEKGADGTTYYIHFTGKDVDTVQHGLVQAETRMKQSLERTARREETRAQRRGAAHRSQGAATRGARTQPGRRVKTRRQTLGAIRQRQKAIAEAARPLGAVRRARTTGAL